MKILVTGGAGYIGSHTSAYAIENNIHTVIVDDLRNAKYSVIEFLQNLNYDKVSFFKIDTSKLENIPIDSNSIDGVIHFAANKSVNESVKDPLKYYDNNINSLIDTLRYVEQNKIKNFVFSSSCTVYGDVTSNPIRESDPVGQIKSPYGYSKVVCERILEDFHRAYPDVNIVILRYFNPIGSHPSWSIGENPVGKIEALMPLICRHVANWPYYEFTLHGNNYNTPDGSCVRDFIDINDLARAHVMCLQWLRGKSGVLEIFNVGTGQGTSVKTILETFKTVNKVNEDLFTKKDWRFIVGPKRDGDVEQIWADTSKIEKEMGYKTEYSLEQSCRNAYNAFFRTIVEIKPGNKMTYPQKYSN
jgi:UDP-glucose 4-epimerase